MRENNKITIAVVIGIILVAVIAVVVLFGRPGDTNEIVSQPVVVEEAVVVSTEVPTIESEVDSEATEAPVTEAPLLPTARVGLHATDPSSVNLATGEIQLVEAFAFW